jgi:hypothetical protein
MHHQDDDAVLLTGVELHYLLPIDRHLVPSLMADKIHQVKNVILKATTAKTISELEELASDTAVGIDRLGHLSHVGTGGITEGCDAVDRANPLGHVGIGGKLEQLSAPEVGAQDPFGSHPHSRHRHSKS